MRCRDPQDGPNRKKLDAFCAWASEEWCQLVRAWGRTVERASPMPCDIHLYLVGGKVMQVCFGDQADAPKKRAR